MNIGLENTLWFLMHIVHDIGSEQKVRYDQDLRQSNATFML